MPEEERGDGGEGWEVEVGQVEKLGHLPDTHTPRDCPAHHDKASDREEPMGEDARSAAATAPSTTPSTAPTGTSSNAPTASSYHDHDFSFEEWRSTAAPLLARIPLMAQAEIDQYLGAGAGPTQCQEAWEAFFQLHSKNASFFKKRRYLPLEFPELQDETAPPRQLLELGCGYGSSLAAVLEANRTIRCTGCDLSPTGLQLLHQRLGPQHGDRLTTFVRDVSRDALPVDLVPPGSMDLVLMVFMLSALGHKDAHRAVLRRAKDALRPGGYVLFRDYAMYDQSMLRNRKRCGPHLFARQDGTLAYFFSVEDFRALVAEVGGLRVVECFYANVINKNRASSQVIHRVFLHAKLQRE